jgi:hypothetical protein
MKLPLLAHLLAHSAALGGRYERNLEARFFGMIMPSWLATVDCWAARYDIVTTDKNWVTVVTGGIGAGLAGSGNARDHTSTDQSEIYGFTP